MAAFCNELDAMLVAKKHYLTPFQQLKQPPGQASLTALLKLVGKLERICKTAVLSVDLSWLKQN
jgi:hypothetical protein